MKLTGVVHCLDHIRAVLMCHGDTTVRTFEWIKTAHYPVLKPKTTRQCRRWDPIVEWAKSRYPSHENGPILEHPKYGRFTKNKNKNTTAIRTGLIAARHNQPNHEQHNPRRPPLSIWRDCNRRLWAMTRRSHFGRLCWS